MKDLLMLIETPYVDAQTLLGLLTKYQRPRECISRMVKAGELIRLKNGFYLIADRIIPKAKEGIPYEQVANVLYGPSYVSLEWALSFYGMIPERVHTVTSMTLGKDKEFNTPVGSFTYHKLPSNCYSVGITLKKSPDFFGNFLIASPEKALADLVFKTCKGLDKKQLNQELIESRRMDVDCLQKLDKKLLASIEEFYHSKRVSYLIDLLGSI